MWTVSPQDVYKLTILLLGVGACIRAAETLWMKDANGFRGIFDWQITGNDLFLRRKYSSFYAAIYGETGTSILSVFVMLSFGAMALLHRHPVYFKPILLVFLILNLAMHYRQSYGLDGADQMALLITLTILLCYTFFEHETIMKIGLAFIASQLALSYIVSGIAKLISKQWRNGLAIEGILGTYTYGSSFTRTVLTRKKTWCLAFAWLTIVFEITFPLGIFLDTPKIFLLLGVGFMFHFSIAATMGLNDFVWAFTAAYPSFYYISTLI